MCGPKFGSVCQKTAKKMLKQEWAMEKPKLDNARKLRGSVLIDPEDGEYKETMKNGRNELEIPMEAAMPCKMVTRKRAWMLRETVARKTLIFERKPCMLVLRKLTNPKGNAWNLLIQEIMRITSQKECDSRIYYNLEFENMFSLAVGENDEQESCYSESTKREKESPLCYVNGHLSSQEC